MTPPPDEPNLCGLTEESQVLRLNNIAGDDGHRLKLDAETLLKEAATKIYDNKDDTDASTFNEFYSKVTDNPKILLDIAPDEFAPMSVQIIDPERGKIKFNDETTIWLITFDKEQLEEHLGTIIFKPTD